VWLGFLPLCLAIGAIVRFITLLLPIGGQVEFGLQVLLAIMTTYGLLCFCAASNEVLRASRFLRGAVDPSVPSESRLMQLHRSRGRPRPRKRVLPAAEDENEYDDEGKQGSAGGSSEN
jgi:hypothetical protein